MFLVHNNKTQNKAAENNTNIASYVDQEATEKEP